MKFESEWPDYPADSFLHMRYSVHLQAIRSGDMFCMMMGFD